MGCFLPLILVSFPSPLTFHCVCQLGREGQGRQQAGIEPQGPRGERSDKEMFSVQQKEKKNPQAMHGAHPGSLESFLLTAAGQARPSPWGMRCRQQANQKGLKEP